MKSIFSSNSSSGDGENRRKFERVEVNFTAQVYVGDEKNKRVGVLRQIGRGGMMIEPEKEFKKGKKYKFIITDRSENIRLEVKAICRYADMRRAGFEFDGLDVHSAVDVGILIGKYYQTDAVVI
jgi:hypothetical protein